MRVLTSLALGASVSLVSAPVLAQAHHGMPVVVQADRVLIGSEFVRRCVDLPQRFVVPPGQTVTAPPDSTWDCVEVAGTLRVDRTHDTVLRFTHLIVLPGGVLEIGTTKEPIPAERHVELIVRDVKIDLARDPFQWGNGLLNFGRQSRVGSFKTPTIVVEDALAGATTLRLATTPQGWRVGDELLLPDTRQPTTTTTRPRREARVTILDIQGQTVTLSKPLDFEHLTVRAPDGRVALKPIVANLTRNIVVRSESVEGTPGHTANIGDGASWDLTSNQLVGLGRTTTNVIDSTTPNLSHIGTNQVGRYTEHNHHAGHGHLGCRAVDNVYIAGRGKWGHVTHGTHDTLVQDNVAVGFHGAGFVTEDGYEVRNKFYNNLAAYIIPESLNSPNPVENTAANRPGVEGSGYWFRSVMNDFQNNQGWNNVVGLNFFAQQQLAGLYPSQPGGPIDTPPNPHSQPSVAIKKNGVYANMLIGVDTWGVVTPIEDLSAVNNAGISIEISQSSTEQVPIYKNPLLVAQPDGPEWGRFPIAIVTNTGYVPSLQIDGGYIGGHAIGIPQGGAIAYVRITDTVLQNALNFDLTRSPTREYTQTRVLHKPLGQHPPQYVVFTSEAPWSGTGPLPADNHDAWVPQIGNRYTARNWQGTGQDVRFFDQQQVASRPVIFSDPAHPTACPERGLTVGQCWDRYGLAYHGDVVKDADALVFEGLINAVALPGMVTRFGPPRGVVTFPTLREPARIEGGNVIIHAILTGDPAAVDVSDVLRVSIDGASPFDVPPSEYQRPTQRQFKSPAVTEGIHEIQTWRLDRKRRVIPESAMRFRYVVGAVTLDRPEDTQSTPPPQTPPLRPGSLERR
jgi:hypothetical protein